MTKINQHVPDAFIKSVLKLYSNGNINDALEKVEVLKNDYPNVPLLFNLSGVFFKAIGQMDDAVNNFKTALELKPDYFEVNFNLGLTLQQCGRLDEAVENFKSAIKHSPDYVDAHASLGNVLKQLGRLEEAIKSYEKTIAIKPNYAEVHNNLGNVLRDFGRLNDAAKCYERAVTIKPDFIVAYNNFGNVLRDFGRLNDAAKCYKKALELNSNFAEAHNNLGIVLMELGKHNEALRCYKNAINIKKDFAEAHSNFGNALKRLKRLDEAAVSFGNAIRINQHIDFVLGDLIYTKMNLCLWDNLSSDLEDLEKKINSNEKTLKPFPSLALIEDPMTQKKLAEIYANERFIKSDALSITSNKSKPLKIRLGYFSPDFRNHAVSSLISELFEIHDRDQFEIHAFYFGPATSDEMNLRIKASVDYYHDVRELAHKDVAKLARNVKLDIAIDLCGYTQDCRPEIFAARAAPLQLSYLGYPGTMGAEFMDYIIADKIIIPKKSQKYYSEKIIYMPDCYQVNISSRVITEKFLSRQELGLPNSGFIFCSFNNSFKISPTIFSGWMRILKNVENSILWLYDDSGNIEKNLKKEAKKHGVNENRLIFANYKPGIDNFSNRIKLVDLFLDSIPYNAHTMASDTLRMGVPVLTCMGDSLASRVAASLLRAVNMNELITNSQEEYELLAIELAVNSQKIKRVKDKLVRNLPSAKLYNTSLFTRHLESAYVNIYERLQNGQSADHIYI